MGENEEELGSRTKPHKVSPPERGILKLECAFGVEDWIGAGCLSASQPGIMHTWQVWHFPSLIFPFSALFLFLRDYCFARNFAVIFGGVSRESNHFQGDMNVVFTPTRSHKLDSCFSVFSLYINKWGNKKFIC